MNWKQIAIPGAALLFGLVIGFFIGKPKEIRDFNVEAALERMKADSLVLQDAYDKLYEQLEANKEENNRITRDYDSISKIHAENRATGVYDGTIQQRIFAIRKRGRALYGN